MMWHSICEKVRYEDSKYRGMTGHRYPVASLVPPVASELHSMLDWWWIAAHHYHHYSMCGNQVQFPSLSCVTVLAINSFQFTARVTTAWELALCFLEWRLHFSGLYVLAQSALWFQGNDHLPSLLASSRSKPKPLLSSPRRHITWSLFQLLFSGTHKLRLNTFHPTFETSWYLPHSHPPFPQQFGWEVGKTNLSFLAWGEECQLPSITLVDVRKHSELLSNVWVIFLSFFGVGNRRTGSSETVRVLLLLAKCPTSALARPLAPLLLALKWKLLLVSRKLGRNERTASLPLKILPFKRGGDLWKYLDVLNKLSKNGIVGILPPFKVSISGERNTPFVCPRFQWPNSMQIWAAQHSSTIPAVLHLCSTWRNTLFRLLFCGRLTQIGIVRHKTFNGFVRWNI